MKFIHWIRKIFCSHTWCRYSPIYHDDISIAQWYYCPKCDNWLHIRYGTQCNKVPYHQKVILGGN